MMMLFGCFVFLCVSVCCEYFEWLWWKLKLTERQDSKVLQTLDFFLLHLTLLAGLLNDICHELVLLNVWLVSLLFQLTQAAFMNC